MNKTGRRWKRRLRAWSVGAGLVLGAIGLVLAPGMAQVASADREYSWTLDKDSRTLASPLPYIYDFEIDGMYQKSGTLKNPADIFIDTQGFVWIADTGNNRVLKFTGDGTFVSQLGSPDGPAKLNAPEGIYVTPLGDIWVADRGNGRLVQFTAVSSSNSSESRRPGFWRTIRFINQIKS